MISAALERKCFANFGKHICYPNLYILMVGPPGTGKTAAIKGVYEFYDKEKIPTLHRAPDDVSRASIIDAVHDARRKIDRQGQPPLIFYSTLACSDELGVFLSQYDPSFLSVLNKLYDGTPYHEKKRGMKDDIILTAPLLTFLAGTSPSWMSQFFPEHAWSEGFTSRLTIIYSSDTVDYDPFTPALDSDTALADDLHADLKQIHSLTGQFVFADEMVPIYRNWHKSNYAPVPLHPRLEDYLPRRQIHFLKLCMVYCAARTNDMVITLEDFQNAQDTLLAAEANLPVLFRSLKSAGSASATIDECHSWVYEIYHKSGKGVRRGEVVAFLSTRMPVNSITYTLDIMVQSGVLIVEPDGMSFRPAPKLQRF